ncbi:class I SAM-dependent methyltransferase [Streptomyces sp. SID12501]|uniref:Class I SAM-dependent methyltransferase n=1 Tax=Streptomyces sp. SID12501 TaxID=2706042 RepID=A0A6B3BPV3_9ACTN|nr:class I SAM-dependent methyltransferase [Streptomyces sp. SID12501]NEC86379.1 class I SAM-dependent methyltransferase [Streptomyces sp. SID12501]
MNGAELEGALWGARALDWAEVQQPTIRPLSGTVLGELGAWQGRTVLDLGCGAGDFAGMASALGANVSGLDASAALIEIAQRRNPTSTFRVGDMQHLPFPDHRFSVVTAFNSLHFARNPARTITEAKRVTHPGGSIVVATWGPPSECDAITYLLDLGSLMPQKPRGPQTSLDPTDLGAFRALMATAGPTSPWRKVHCPWEYPDLSTALRGLLSTGPAAQAINHSGRTQVTDTITQSIAPYRRGDGSYSLSNTCYYLITTTNE